MRLTKMMQAYLGLMSVVALTLVGAAAFSWQNITSKADTVTQSVSPVLNILIDKESLKVGEEATATITGDFPEAVTGATVVINYPADLVEVSDISADDGVLSKPTESLISADAKTITLKFSPLSGSTSGILGTFKIKATKTGLADLTFVTEAVNETDETTRLTTVSTIGVEPIAFGATLTIE